MVTFAFHLISSNFFNLLLLSQRFSSFLHYSRAILSIIDPSFSKSVIFIHHPLKLKDVVAVSYNTLVAIPSHSRLFPTHLTPTYERRQLIDQRSCMLNLARFTFPVAL